MSQSSEMHRPRLSLWDAMFRPVSMDRGEECSAVGRKLAFGSEGVSLEYRHQSDF